MVAKKKAPKVTDILLEIRDEIRNTNVDVKANTKSIADLAGRFDGLGQRFDDLGQRFEDSGRVTNARFESLENALTQGFAQLGEKIDRVGARLDNVRDFAGASFRDHEDRIREVERRTGVRPPDDE